MIMPSRRVVAALAALALALPAHVAHATDDVTSGGVVFHRDGLVAELSNQRVARRWGLADTVAGRRVFTVNFRDVATGADPVAGNLSPDFTLALGGVVVRSSDLALRSLDAVAVANGVRASFVYEPVPTSPLPETISVHRDVTLRDSSSVFEITTTLHNGSPAPLSVSAYSLDEIWPRIPAAAETQRYAGGSDWRDDFRAVRTHAADQSFDDEGEVGSFGSDAGWFFVSERRGGVMNRIVSSNEAVDGLTGQMEYRTAAAVDYARDILDGGPITYGTPETNHIDNPAYPVPARARRVLPLSDLKLGTVATGVYHGGEQEAAARYVEYLVRDRMAAYPHQVTLNSFHPWSHGADYNATTMQAQAAVAKSLGVDTIILDDQWQGGLHGESGDWNWDHDPASVDGDPARFPPAPGCDKPAEIICSLANKGLKLGLWMSPAEFSGNIPTAPVPTYTAGQPGEKASEVFLQHPHWSCLPVGTATSQYGNDAGEGVWDFNNADLRAYMTSVIDRAVNQWGVHYFKFDYQTWVDCWGHDYNDYEEAFVGWIDSLEQAHPDVTFEFDETNDQRLWAFESVARGPSWFDNGHDHKDQNGNAVKDPAQILHDIWSASPWIPPSSLGVGLYDGTLKDGYPPDFLMAMATLTHMTFWTDLTKLTDAQKSTTSWWLDWYHANASRLGGGVYELTTEDPWDSVAPAAFQPWDASNDSGFVYLFRQTGAAPAAKLLGVDVTHSYTLTNVRTGAVLGTFSGADLAAGNVSWPSMAANSALVYQVTPAP